MLGYKGGSLGDKLCMWGIYVLGYKDQYGYIHTIRHSVAIRHKASF